MKIAVFNTFDITPAQNGGEIRMVNIYSRLSRQDQVRVISYDLRCKQPIRRERLAPALDIVDTRVTDRDRWAFFQANERLGLYPHDTLSIDTYCFSGPFLREIDRALRWADVVVVSHPYLATHVFPRCLPRQLRVLEAHNVEIDVKKDFYSAARDRALATTLIDATHRAEAMAAEDADLVLAVGRGDAERLVGEYGIDADKVHIVPNGVTVDDYDVIPSDACAAMRAEAMLDQTDVAVFLGSAYGPNVDSYRMARAWLDEAGFTGTVLIVGSIIDAFDPAWPAVSFDERWLGFVSDETKRLLLKAADFTLQIVTSGGGTNLKLFDYMASGTPILANAFGRRGIEEDGWCLAVEDARELSDIVRDRRWLGAEARERAATAHAIVSRDFDWDRISDQYRAILS